MHRPIPLVLVLALLAPLFVACGGDTTSAVGELGRIEYTLYTHYVVSEESLLDVQIVTGHQQLLMTRLTDKGDQQRGKAEDVVHTIEPSAGASVEQGTLIDGVPELWVTVTDPGAYTLYAMVDDRTFDYIELDFETPDDLELITWTRGPYEDGFVKADSTGTVAVEEGTQAAFLPVPTAGGVRLVGDIATAMEADPAWAVVPGENLVQIYEQHTLSYTSPVSLYFIEPGDVAVILTDEANGISAARDFAVDPVQH